MADTTLTAAELQEENHAIRLHLRKIEAQLRDTLAAEDRLFAALEKIWRTSNELVPSVAIGVVRRCSANAMRSNWNARRMFVSLPVEDKEMLLARRKGTNTNG